MYAAVNTESSATQSRPSGITKPSFLTANKRDGAMKDLIKRIVQALVDNPEQVEVSEVESGRTLILEIRMAKEDIGKVIGKQGRTAQAIRTILRAASGKLKKHIIFEILE